MGRQGERLINGHRINIAISGPEAAPTIVFVHGFPLDHMRWQPQIEALSATHRIIAYDVRGHGRSEVGDGQYVVDAFADDLIALVDDVAKTKIIACGLSMGGYIVLRA